MRQSCSQFNRLCGIMPIDHALHYHFGSVVACLSDRSCPTSSSNLLCWQPGIDFSLPSHLLDGLACLHHFCSLLDLQIDKDSLYLWSTSAEGHRGVVSLSQMALKSISELGILVAKLFILHNFAIVSRLSALRRHLEVFSHCQVHNNPRLPRKLTCCNCSSRECIGCAGQWPHHCIEISGRASLRWDRAARPLSRNSLIHPGWYQLWRSVSMFKRQCSTNQLVRDGWELFTVLGTQRPFWENCWTIARFGIAAGYGRLSIVFSPWLHSIVDCHRHFSQTRPSQSLSQHQANLLEGWNWLWRSRRFYFFWLSRLTLRCSQQIRRGWT